MQETLFNTESRPLARLDRRPITAREWACVEAGLDEFNIQAGSKLGALRGDGGLSYAGRMIGMRSRHFPDLSPEDFRAIVRRGFERRWWKGRPGPGVIFNPGVFEALVAGPTAPPEDEFTEYLRSLDSEVIDGHAEEIR